MSSTRPSPGKLNCELPFEEFIHPEETQEITSSKTYQDGRWNHLTKLGGFPAGIEKSVLPVDASSFRILVVTVADAGTEMPSHSHDEAILRYVIKGSLTIDGTTYRAGEWVLMPKDYSYSIRTEEGYTTLAGYGEACTGWPPN